MRFEWFIVKYRNGVAVWRTHHPLSKSSANDDCVYLNGLRVSPSNSIYKVVHRSDLQDV